MGGWDGGTKDYNRKAGKRKRTPEFPQKDSVKQKHNTGTKIKQWGENNSNLQADDAPSLCREDFSPLAWAGCRGGLVASLTFCLTDDKEKHSCRATLTSVAVYLR